MGSVCLECIPFPIFDATAKNFIDVSFEKSNWNWIEIILRSTGAGTFKSTGVGASQKILHKGTVVNVEV